MRVEERIEEMQREFAESLRQQREMMKKLVAACARDAKRIAESLRACDLGSADAVDDLHAKGLAKLEDGRGPKV